MERPDLTDLPEEIIAYIESLEMKIMALESQEASQETPETPQESPTSQQIITITAEGIAKRTPRHLYTRQNRGGMGVFDLTTGEDSPPAVVTVADERDTLLILTNHGRAYRWPVRKIEQGEVRDAGEDLYLPTQADERIVAALPMLGQPYLLLASERGWVRRVRNVRFTQGMINGTRLHDPEDGGELVAACWSPTGEGYAFVATQKGLGIRFLEGQIHRDGTLGLRVDPDDVVVGIAHAPNERSGVLLMSHDGKGTIRIMSGFRANKAPGAGGKVAIKTDKLVGVASINPKEDDVFCLSQLSKMVRFQASDIPAKTGVVQGVKCMGLRNDEVVATAVCSFAEPAKI